MKAIVLAGAKIAGLAFLAFAAMVAFGLLFTAYTHPAQAMPAPVANPGNTPVPKAELDQLWAENQSFKTCLGARDATGVATQKMNQAFLTAITAQDNNNRAEFNRQRDIFHAELARLDAVYGCQTAIKSFARGL